MVTTERPFAIPCTCGTRVRVSAGQAGGRTTCGGCGRPLDVPRLRDLATHAADAEPGPAGSGWDAGRGMVFAGCALALLATLAALAAEPLGGAIIGRSPAPQAIRQSVAAAPIAAVHAAYTQAANEGLNRPPSAVEVRLQQYSRLAKSLAAALWVVAVGGGLVALAGFALRSARGGSRREAS